MTTYDLVPRSDNEGNIGTLLKKWSGANFYSINAYGGTISGVDVIVPSGTIMDISEGTILGPVTTSAGISSSFKIVALNEYGKLDETLTEGSYNFTDSSTINIDWKRGTTYYGTINGNRTITFSNPTEGRAYRIVVTQGAAGNFQLIWPSNVYWQFGQVPIFTSLADKTDIVTFLYVNNKYYGSIISFF